MSRTLFVFAMVTLLILAASVPAQITINSGSFPAIGTTFITYSAGPVAVDLGDPGPNQTWDFSDYEFGEDGYFELLQPSSTPYYASFDNPTHCFGITVEGSAAYSYLRVEGGGLYDLGYAGEIEGVPLSFVYNPAEEVITFPLTYQTAWTGVSRYTFGTITYTDSSINLADAWGSLITPEETWQVLRIKRHTFSITRIGQFPPQTTESYSYDFLTANGFTGGSVTNAEGTADPDFTQGLIDATAIGTLAAESPRGPVNMRFSVMQNYPNPFNPLTNLPVELDQPAQLSITIYDELGRVVSTKEYDLGAGRHDLYINGSSWPSGSYFARVTNGTSAQTVPMQLIK